MGALCRSRAAASVSDRLCSTRLGDTHPHPKTVQSNFRYLLPQVIEQGRTAELSDDPGTQAVLQQLGGGEG
jgi:hypothetical protein